MAKKLNIKISKLSAEDRETISKKIVPHTADSAKEAKEKAAKAQRKLGLEPPTDPQKKKS